MDWLNSSNWQDVQQFAVSIGPRSDRKHRLLAVAAARAVSHLYSKPAVARMIELAEMRADLVPSQRDKPWEAEWQRVGSRAYSLASELDGAVENMAAWASALLWNDGQVLEMAAMVFGMVAVERAGLLPWPADRYGGPDIRSHPVFRAGRDIEGGQALAPLIRDIFGNPFCPVAFAPAWRTEAAVALARGMYESRDFAPMRVL
ncbi:MAG TPA: hypothetical protein VH092_28060, partial [Urbifossiella sp.]|nr:hypothetical protein [Urbifossiella sp.]